MKFSKFKIGVTGLHTPKKIFHQQENGEPVHVTVKDLTDAGVPENEIERHIELGTIVGLEGSEIKPPAKDADGDGKPDKTPKA